MIEFTVIAALVVVLLTIYLIYHMQRKEQSKSKTRDAAPSKPTSKEELLSARIKHFENLKYKKSDIENTTNEAEMDAPVSSQFQNPTTTKKNSDGDSQNLISKKVKDSSDKILSTGKMNEYLLVSSSYFGLILKPESKPIRTLPELLNWIPGFDDNLTGRIIRRPTFCDSTKPKTLVCHDMKGGYIEDRFVQGYNSDKCFTFNQWNQIDSFCYFSHSFVTIPPPCWTNAAHSHGVKVLGTIITEWQDGAAICAEMFQDIGIIDKVVSNLVELAKYYQFDGWLINIENPIDPNKVHNVCYFLKKLTNLMHTEITDSEVIWYDSVIETGELKWQNKLCMENVIFFNACDGIFLNYNWSLADLQHSLTMSKPNRQFDVYVGVDVFGRGCYGGGGWNTYKAMDVIREQKLSAAIFAPGWVHETLDVDKFPENEENFWKLLRTYLYEHCPSTLPFVSTFCQGYGKKLFFCGQEISPNPWTNLSATSIQPSFYNNFYQMGPYDGMQIIMKSTGFSSNFGFNGGGCYVIDGLIKPFAEQTKTIFRLFETKISLKPDKDYFLSYSFYSSTDKIDVYITLLFEDRPNYLLFMPPKERFENEGSIKYKIPSTQEGNYVEIYPRNDCASCYGGYSVSKDWSTRNYTFSLEQRGLLKEMRFAVTTGGIIDEMETSSFSVRIGEVRVHNVIDLSMKLPTPVNIKYHNVSIRDEGNKKWISLALSWEIITEQGFALPKCFDIFCMKNCDLDISYNSSSRTIKIVDNDDENDSIYIGRAYTNSYYISDLIVPSECSGVITLMVQCISYAEVRQNQKNVGSISFRW